MDDTFKYKQAIELSKVQRWQYKLNKLKSKKVGKSSPLFLVKCYYVFSSLFIWYFLRVASPPLRCLSDLFSSKISLTLL